MGDMAGAVRCARRLRGFSIERILVWLIVRELAREMKRKNRGQALRIYILRLDGVAT